MKATPSTCKSTVGKAVTCAETRPALTTGIYTAGCTVGNNYVRSYICDSSSSFRQNVRT